jgi:hypothetical protein
MALLKAFVNWPADSEWQEHCTCQLGKDLGKIKSFKQGIVHGDGWLECGLYFGQ